MKPTDFSICLQSFLGDFLPSERNVTENTVKTYAHVFRLLLRYFSTKCRIQPDHLTLERLTYERVIGFLDWLERERGNSVKTRNLRLAAIHSFCRHLQRNVPERLAQWQRILAIEAKQTAVDPHVEHLSPQEMKMLLAMPDSSTKKGLREQTLMSLLYDAGLRVHELCGMLVSNVRLQSPKQIQVMGKGRKRRAIPLHEATAALLVRYCKVFKLDVEEHGEHPLFFNVHGKALSRGGVRYILLKNMARAAKSEGRTVSHVHPHMLRHSKAMHLLNSGNPMAVVQSFLGHANVVTTCRYAKSNIENMRTAIEKAPRVSPATDSSGSWKRPGIMEWLEDL